jgi:hypothetical protein
MKTILFCCLFLTTCCSSFAQEERSPYIRKGLLRAQATIAPGILLKENASTISLHGNLEYYVADNVSFRGDSYYFLQAKFDNNINPLRFNHSIFSGASYHFKTKNHFDPYLAIEPGISFFEKITNPIPDGAQSLVAPIYGNRAINPLVSSALGFNFYFERWFHLFGEARYIYGNHLSDAVDPMSLSELRFSFGLGFNLNLIRKKE